MTERPPLPRDVLEYFRSVIQAEPDAEPWHLWWERHGEELRAFLRPGDHLRMRMGESPRIMREFLAAAGYTWQEPASRFNPKFYRPDPIPSAWLVEQVSPAEVEAEFAGNGFLLELWRWLVSQMEPQDQVWSFSTPGKMWENLMGASGFTLVRNGKAYDSITLMRS